VKCSSQTLSLRSSGTWTEIDTRTYMRARYNLGLAMWKQGKRDDALRVFQELVRLDRQDHLGARLMIEELAPGRKRSPGGRTGQRGKPGPAERR